MPAVRQARPRRLQAADHRGILSIDYGSSCSAKLSPKARQRSSVASLAPQFALVYVMISAIWAVAISKRALDLRGKSIEPHHETSAVWQRNWNKADPVAHGPGGSQGESDTAANATWIPTSLLYPRFIESDLYVDLFSSREPPKLLLIFLHLHKTAGNNLKTHLFAFAKKNGLNLHHTCHRARKNESFAYRVLMNHRLKHPEFDYDCNLHELVLDMSTEERLALDMIVGHQYYGAHYIIPGRIGTYFTFMRHPLRRKISHYGHFEASNYSVSQYRETRNEEPLVHYLTSRNLNYMTKRLAGLGTSFWRPGSRGMWQRISSKISAHLLSSDLLTDLRDYMIETDAVIASTALELAELHLRNNFFFVGLQERFAESMCVLVEMLNKESVYEDFVDSLHASKHSQFEPFDVLSRLKSTRERVMHEMDLQKVLKTHLNQRTRSEDIAMSLSESTISRVLDAERLDVHLYNVAEDIFAALLQRYPHCVETARHRASGPA
ncbi:hypothetical protein FVE85_6666 [Porphyridium purpureum]|uniref:Uncharacterized protein n=1 Tax=Porphyridium purpureum TaxID=35688 RepID=A0A5J4Z5F0_PORPP|nr:hypothetical protein FVE85_6666 [Porphyridium purpureum]|eukprot:POR5506..scf295_1